MNLYIILSQTCIHPSLHIDNQVLPTLRFTCLCTSVLVHIVRCIRSIQFHVVACAIIAYLHAYLTCIHAHTCTHTRIHAYMPKCLHACMHTYIQTCSHTHIYKIHRRTYIYYIYIYIHIYMVCKYFPEKNVKRIYYCLSGFPKYSNQISG
jgi:hypothetical protein